MDSSAWQEQFEEQLRRCGVTELAPFPHGKRLGRSYCTGEYRGRRLFIKLQKNNDPHDGAKLRKEARLLACLGETVYSFPGCEDFAYVAMDYYTDCETLLGMYIRYKQSGAGKTGLARAVRQSFSCYGEFVRKLDRSDIPLEKEDWLRKVRTSCLKLAMTSGWDRVPGAERREILYTILSFLLLVPIGILCIGPKKRAVSHGDFHWGNVLGRPGDWKIVDLENLCRGDPNLDVAFYYVRLERNFRDDPELTRALQEGLEDFRATEYYHRRVFSVILPVFRFLVRHNPRFL